MIAVLYNSRIMCYLFRDDGEVYRRHTSHTTSGDDGENVATCSSGISSETVMKTRPPDLEINYQEDETHQYSEVIAPATPPPSRFQIKWSAALHHERSLQIRSKQRVPRAVRIYYRKQKKDIATLKEARKLSSLGSENDLKGLSERFEEEVMGSKKMCSPQCPSYIQLSTGTAARLTLSVNILLFFLKLAATIQSGSLAVLSSLIDSALDLFSGVVIGISTYLIKRYDRFHYPIGRNRLEPVAIIITAAVMGTAALQIITSAIDDIASSSINPNINIFSGIIIGFTIILKGSLYVLCRQVNNPSVQALAVDHRNDIASNIVTLVFGLIGTYVFPVIDPIGAILLSLYIIFNWIVVGYEQLKNLVGHTADRRFLSKLTWIAANHDKRIESVDTIRAYTFGVNYLVEVDIQLPPDMALKEAHDIGESLQQKLESLGEVERAFVHLDFETLHSPSVEHKLPH